MNRFDSVHIHPHMVRHRFPQPQPRLRALVRLLPVFLLARRLTAGPARFGWSRNLANPVVTITIPTACPRTTKAGSQRTLFSGLQGCPVTRTPSNIADTVRAVFVPKKAVGKTRHTTHREIVSHNGVFTSQRRSSPHPHRTCRMWIRAGRTASGRRGVRCPWRQGRETFPLTYLIRPYIRRHNPLTRKEQPWPTSPVTIGTTAGRP